MSELNSKIKEVSNGTELQVAVPGFKSRDSRPKNINYSLNSDLVNAEFEITKLLNK